MVLTSARLWLLSAKSAMCGITDFIQDFSVGKGNYAGQWPALDRRFQGHSP